MRQRAGKRRRGDGASKGAERRDDRSLQDAANLLQLDSHLHQRLQTFCSLTESFHRTHFMFRAFYYSSRARIRPNFEFY